MYRIWVLWPLMIQNMSILVKSYDDNNIPGRLSGRDGTVVFVNLNHKCVGNLIKGGKKITN